MILAAILLLLAGAAWWAHVRDAKPITELDRWRDSGVGIDKRERARSLAETIRRVG